MILNTIADLQALSSIPTDNHAHVMGYNTPADGGGGDFYWDATSNEDENYGTIFESPLIATGSGNPGRWLRYYSESINVKWFGATGDGTTNDAPAFQKMIDWCEHHGVKDVIIPYGEFYLEESVYVRIGGIRFIGQGSLLREESWTGLTGIITAFPDVYGNYNHANAFKGSALIIKKDISGIIYDPSVCDSVYWRGVQFRAKEGRKVGTTYAIDFRATFSGPTWPFNVHECHFNGFNKVFSFECEGDLLYDIASVDITHCAFKQNDEIFYQGFKDGTNDRYVCWGFNFQYNKCHDNTRIIYGYLAKDLVTISNNNMEGNIAYSKESLADPNVYPSHIVDIEIDDCAVIFHGNHFEGMASDCVSISSLRKNANGTYKATDGTTALGTSHYVDIYGNSIGTGEPHRIYTLVGCIVKINEQTPIFVHACEILENTKSHVYLTDYALENGSIVKFSNREWLPTNFVKELSFYRILRNPSEQAYLDNNGEQWIRTRSGIFNIGNGYGYDTSDVKYCISVYKVKNDINHFSTTSSPRYAGWSADTYVTGTLFPPLGESLIVCIFPEKPAYGNVFRTALDLILSGSDIEPIEVSSSVFSYLTVSESPGIFPVFEASNVVDEAGTFEAGQTWYNGTNLRTATSSGTVGTLSGVYVSNVSDNKIQLNNISQIAQGQYIELDDHQYKIIELRGDWATLDSTPMSTNGYVTFVAPTFCDIIDSDNVDYYAILNQNASAQSANFYINGTAQMSSLQVGVNTPTVLAEIREASESYPGGVPAATKSVLKLGRNGSFNYTYPESAEFRIGHGGSGTSGSKLDLFINGASNITNEPDQHAMTWNYDGNVGIGSTSPAQKLDVNGTIRQSNVTSAMVKANNSGDLVAAVAGTDYMQGSDFVTGTYTPTITGSDTYTASTFIYTRVKNHVHVSGSVDVVLNGLGYHNFLMSLPVNSNILDEENLTGVLSGILADPYYSYGAISNFIEGDVSTDKAKVYFHTSVDSKVYLQFDYIVQ